MGFRRGGGRKEKKEGGLRGREMASVHYYMCLFSSFVLLNPEPAAMIEPRSMRFHGYRLVSECLSRDFRALGMKGRLKNVEGMRTACLREREKERNKYIK